MKAKNVVGNAARAILILALVEVPAPSAAAQAPNPRGNGATASAKSQTAKKPAGGPHEGIKVHGHWVIEVRNPDGTLVSRTEFDNALHSFGADTLPKIMARQASFGPWSILMDGNSPPCRLSGNPNTFFCDVFEPALNPTFLANGTSFPTLTVSAPSTGANAGALVLSGYLTAAANGDFSRVGTKHLVCAPTAAPSVTCTPSTAIAGLTTSELFTDHFLPNAIQVVAGQIVQVTVVIRFS